MGLPICSGGVSVWSMETSGSREKWDIGDKRKYGIEKECRKAREERKPPSRKWTLSLCWCRMPCLNHPSQPIFLAILTILSTHKDIIRFNKILSTLWVSLSKMLLSFLNTCCTYNLYHTVQHLFIFKLFSLESYLSQWDCLHLKRG